MQESAEALSDPARHRRALDRRDRAAVNGIGVNLQIQFMIDSNIVGDSSTSNDLQFARFVVTWSLGHGDDQLL
jgi:hypothetical protein